MVLRILPDKSPLVLPILGPNELGLDFMRYGDSEDIPLESQAIDFLQNL